MRNWFLGASLVLMVACSGAENTANLPKDTVRISNTSLGGAVIGENYSASFGVMGGVSPYIINVTDGKLPPGVTVSNSGTISGTPTEKGSYTFTVQVTDANLSTKVQKYTLAVTDPPPPELSLELPGTPVKSETRIPVVLRNAEKVAGGRFTMSVPEGLTVKAVQPVTGKPLVLWNVKNNVLTVDFAFTQKFFRNKNALFLQVESSKEAGVYISPLGSTNYDLRDAGMKKIGGTDLLSPPPKAEPANTPASGTGTDPKAPTTDPAKPDPTKAPEGAGTPGTGATDPVDPAEQPAQTPPAENPETGQPPAEGTEGTTLPETPVEAPEQDRGTPPAPPVENPETPDSEGQR